MRVTFESLLGDFVVNSFWNKRYCNIQWRMSWYFTSLLFSLKINYTLDKTLYSMYISTILIHLFCPSVTWQFCCIFYGRTGGGDDEARCCIFYGRIGGGIHHDSFRSYLHSPNFTKVTFYYAAFACAQYVPRVCTVLL